MIAIRNITLTVFAISMSCLFGCTEGSSKDALIRTEEGKYWRESDTASSTYGRVYAFSKEGTCKMYVYNTAANGYIEYSVSDIRDDGQWKVTSDSLFITGDGYLIEELTSNSLVIKGEDGKRRTFSKEKIDLK